MNVSNIIHLALKQLGVLATGESATAEDVADGIDCLRMLLTQWHTQKLYIYKITPFELVVDGSKQLIHGVLKLADTALLDSEPVTLIRDSDLHFFPNSHGVIYGYLDNAVWVQAKRGKVLKLNALQLPTSFDVDDELDVPMSYERALVLSLALELAPMYGVEPSPLLVRNQANAIDLLKRANSTPFWVKNDLPVGLGGGACGCG